MTQDHHTIRKLFRKILTDQCTAEEAALFFQLVRELPVDDVILAELENHWDTVVQKGYVSDVVGSAMRDKLLQRIRQSSPSAVIQTSSPLRLLRTGWFRYAAVLVLFLVGVSVYVRFGHLSPSQQLVGNTQQLSVPPDVLPGTNRAILTLSDGNNVELDSAATNTIRDGSSSIQNSNGQLLYVQGDSPLMNTLTTPRGGQYQLKLSDGTQVWLNAASSITYPSVFTGDERKVKIAGEVYFEVTKNTKAPFFVTANEMEIEVLGTRFNVNVYPDEAFSHTTLFEGSIKLKTQKEKVLLNPGQQGHVFTNGAGDIQVVSEADLSQVIAWQKGLFGFNNMTLPGIMRLVSRWYDVDIRYEGVSPKKKFGGGISRKLPLSHLLKMLEANGVNVKVEGKTLIVLK